MDRQELRNGQWAIIKPFVPDAPLKKSQTTQCLGRYRGGFGTKRHAVSEDFGLPLRFQAGPEFEHDMKQAQGLIEGLQTQYVLADKAYDADSLIQTIHDNNAKACIPPKTNHLEQRAYDKNLYKERNQLELMFGKLIKTCMGSVKRAAIYLWLK